nr:integrase, catalytic region, zinc finger, CCHC-type, peptidase aspartic, catalytic [Tanacetum cinerariifolium]
MGYLHGINDAIKVTLFDVISWFKASEPVEYGSVLYMGDDYFSLVHGKGSVVLEFSSRKSITLFNVLYVLKLRKNLISGPVLNKCGYKQEYGEYSQWSERFMNYLEEQMDEEEMIHSIKNGDQPLPTITQVSIAGATSSEQPPLKDKSMWSDQEKKIRKIDRLARFLLIQDLPNDIYSLIDMINDLKKCGYSKDNCELNFKFLNNLQPEWKQYATMMRQNKNLLDINIDALYNILKQNQGDVNDAMKSNKKEVMITSNLLALVAEQTKVTKRKEKVVVSSESKGSDDELKMITTLVCEVDEKKRDISKVKCYNFKKEGHFSKDCKKAKVKDYEYYKTKMLLAKKDKDEQVLLAEDHAWMESSSDSDQEINTNKVFMAQLEKVLSDFEKSSSSLDDTIAEVSYYTSKSEYETLEYYDNFTNYGLFVNNDDDQEIFHDSSEIFFENHIGSQMDHDQSAVDHNNFEETADMYGYCKYHKKTANTGQKQTRERKEYTRAGIFLSRKQIIDQEILFDMMSRQLVELDENVRMLKNTVFEKDLKISELEERVRNKDLEIEKCLERLNECENKLHKIGQINQTIHMIMPSKDKMYNGRKGIGFENPSYFCKAKDLRPTLYDKRVIGLGYTSRFLAYSNEALEIEKFKRVRENKIEFAYDYGNLNASYVTEKINFSDDYFEEIINLDFEKIDSPLQQTSSLKPHLPTVILEKIIIDLEDEVVSLLDKDKENLKIIESLKSKGYLDTFSSVRRPKDSKVEWKKKGSFNNFKVKLSYYNHSSLNKNVKQYSRKDLMSCNNSHLKDTRSAFVCNNARNASCNASINAYDDIVQICLWIINSGCSKHMTGNRALLTNFVEKFLRKVRFGNNDFAVIGGYGDVVIGYMMIKKVYYVKGLGHNLFSVGKFCDKGLEVAFRKSTCFVRNENGVDLLTGDRSSNLYTIALNEIASNSLNCLLEKVSSS